MTTLKNIALLGLFLCLVAAGCSKDAEVRTCNPGTVLLSFSCAAALDNITGTVDLEGLAGQKRSTNFSLACPGAYKVEVNVSGYQQGGVIKALVSARAGDMVLAKDRAVNVTLDEGCTKFDIDLDPRADNPDAPVSVNEGDGGAVEEHDGSQPMGPDADPTATGLSRGEACVRDDQCTEGHCADGVCCDNTCDGVCMACTFDKTGSTTGQCAPTKSGVAHAKCETKDAKTCGTTGMCNGAGKCSFWDSTNECVAATCTGGDYVPAQKCNGTGSCQAASPSKCGEYACTPQGCKTGCVGNNDCSAGVQCINGKCGGKRALGDSCNGNSECTSPGFCIDGVCCGSKCDGVCEACSANITGGNNGECIPIPASKGIQAECTVQSASSCGTTGRCDGARQCEFFAAGTDCAAQMCTGTTQTAARKCDGAGTCLAAMTTDCVPGKCDAATKQCKLTCGADGDCAAGAYCDGNTCKPKKGAAAMCGRPGECGSNFCADGKCCNQACSGSCLECSTGTCKPVTNAEDPGTCSGTKSCSPAGACLAKNGQPCSAPGDCISGQCTTFYRDQDGDGQGALVGESFCGTSSPSGYVTIGSDCCDIDPASYRDVQLKILFMDVPNKCGSFDWNCSNGPEKTPISECTTAYCKKCSVSPCSAMEEHCTLNGYAGLWSKLEPLPACGQQATRCVCDDGVLSDCVTKVQLCR
ncbi:MAG: hypothetical protein SF187_00555 [Deltaproteobacteria bacterium]|nr:hypothetical protein [Deltaproteobacteria bacterium]